MNDDSQRVLPVRIKVRWLNDEAMNFLSGVRLAVGLKLITDLSVYTLNKLLIFSQSAHLVHAEGRQLMESEANIARARFVRGMLAADTGSTR